MLETRIGDFRGIFHAENDANDRFCKHNTVSSSDSHVSKMQEHYRINVSTFPRTDMKINTRNCDVLAKNGRWSGL